MEACYDTWSQTNRAYILLKVAVNFDLINTGPPIHQENPLCQFQTGEKKYCIRSSGSFSGILRQGQSNQKRVQRQSRVAWGMEIPTKQIRTSTPELQGRPI
jgi:hypothetical protein